MTIKTKHTVGDLVFFIKDQKSYWGIVDYLCTYTNEKSTTISYSIKISEDSDFSTIVNESHVYTSDQEYFKKQTQTHATR